MTEVFKAMPGLTVPVAGIAEGFVKLWEDSPAKESRAVQLNLVLHFGRNCTPADAEAQFQTTLRFAHRYPCRVVVLCPDFDESAPPEMGAKIYGECFFGKSKSDTRCVEFVFLHYTMAVRAHLENQVSVCLSTDMPLYYWAHHFSSVKRMADYSYLLTRSKRILFDGGLVPPEAFTYPWPNQSAVRNLAYTRTLPLRQNLGQFLSRYTPALINEGLKSVTLRYQPAVAAEASSLIGWIKKGLVRSGAAVDFNTLHLAPGLASGSFDLVFTYQDAKKNFHWQADLAKNEASFDGDLGTGHTQLTVGAHLLSPEMMLSEAMFF
jgi:hypothetical protein